MVQGKTTKLKLTEKHHSKSDCELINCLPEDVLHHRSGKKTFDKLGRLIIKNKYFYSQQNLLKECIDYSRDLNNECLNNSNI